MERDMSCFDLDAIELVKKKYYNAAKVAELVGNAKAAYAQLAGENDALRAQLEALNQQKNQISDTLMSAQDIARQMLDDARIQADETARLAQMQAEETIKAAEKKAELILAGAKSKRQASDAEVSEVQEYALKCVENCVDKLRQQHVEAIEYLNSQWQDFLSGLIIPGDEKPEEQPAEEIAELAPPQPVDWMALASMELPEIEDPYADIDAETFFSGNFFAEQSGMGILQELKNMMDSIGINTEEK